jgi:hypothetical protein
MAKKVNWSDVNAILSKIDAADALSYHYTIDNKTGNSTANPIDLRTLDSGIYEPTITGKGMKPISSIPKETKYIVTDKNGNELSSETFDTVMEALSHADTFDMETIVDTKEVPINNVKIYNGDKLIAEASSYGIDIDKWSDDNNPFDI